MAAQIDLGGRSEPAQVEVVTHRIQESGLADVHLGGDVLYPGGVGRAVERADDGGIAGEGFVREGVDVVERRLSGLHESVIGDVADVLLDVGAFEAFDGPHLEGAIDEGIFMIDYRRAGERQVAL